MMERRDFVRTLGAAALGQVLQPRTPSPYPRAPLRKLDRIGLQLYTVRHAMEKDVEGTIARVAAIGYREVEFAGYFGKSARDRKSTRLNSSHLVISYAVFCLKKKTSSRSTSPAAHSQTTATRTRATTQQPGSPY